MEILFLISWIIGLIFCLICTVIAWKTRNQDINKEMWNDLIFMWIGVILTGWVTGFGILMLMIYVVFVRPRFEKNETRHN